MSMKGLQAAAGADAADLHRVIAAATGQQGLALENRLVCLVAAGVQTHGEALGPQSSRLQNCPSAASGCLHPHKLAVVDHILGLSLGMLGALTLFQVPSWMYSL